MYMHQIIVLGRATKDAEVIAKKKKNPFVKVTLAVNEYNATTKEEKVYFYDVLIFGKTGDKALESVKKGDVFMAMGKPEADAYISSKDNEAKASVTVLADSWRVLK